jgi:putative two-component system response regulator
VAGSARSADTSSRRLVLVVEDDISIRMLVTRILELEGYRVMAVADGELALRAVAQHLPDLVLLDLGLPRMDGHEVCRRLRADPFTEALPIILLTGSGSLEDMVAGLDAGADDFIAKPFRLPELTARIRSTIRMRDAMARMRQAHQMVFALANAVEAQDKETGRHCQRLAHWAGRVGVRLGLGPSELEAIVYGAMLHDVGKIGVRDSILLKPGPLTLEESRQMRLHPEIGERICDPVDPERTWLPIIRHHHERWDGTGYPDRLVGDAAPIGARVVAIVDAFDAMLNVRPYSPAFAPEQAVEELRANAGSQFDPMLVPLLIDEWERSAAGIPVPVHLPPLAVSAF